MTRRSLLLAEYDEQAMDRATNALMLDLIHDHSSPYCRLPKEIAPPARMLPARHTHILRVNLPFLGSVSPVVYATRQAPAQSIQKALGLSRASAVATEIYRYSFSTQWVCLLSPPMNAGNAHGGN
jgi:hypothetical protein